MLLIISHRTKYCTGILSRNFIRFILFFLFCKYPLQENIASNLHFGFSYIVLSLSLFKTYIIYILHHQIFISLSWHASSPSWDRTLHIFASFARPILAFFPTSLTVHYIIIFSFHFFLRFSYKTRKFLKNKFTYF